MIGKITLQSVLMLIILTVITGVLYPLAITIASSIIFPAQASGSLQMTNGQTVGSALLGQPFSSDKYFWGRPSASGYYGYGIDAIKDDRGTPVPNQVAFAASGGSNQGPTNATLKQSIQERADAFRKANGLKETDPIPAEMLMASASGLDPHISPEAARLQIDRVATARGLSHEQIASLVDRYVEGPQLGLFGEPRVNVLMLNLALDQLK